MENKKQFTFETSLNESTDGNLVGTIYYDEFLKSRKEDEEIN